MAGGKHRVEIGFEGGQVVAARLDDGSLKDLRKAIGTSGSHELESEGETLILDPGKVIFVRILADEARVGFQAD
ncbi:MAG: hypothetical protein ACO3ZZ_01640 [Solirubrobacterales bacterium]